MALFEKKTWRDRVAEFPTRRTLIIRDTKENGNVLMVDVQRSEGVVSEVGDAFSKANMDDLEKRIVNAFGAVLTTTLAANATSVSFTNAAITSTSIIDPYTDPYGVNPTAMKVSGNTLTMTFNARSEAVKVMVIVRRGV